MATRPKRPKSLEEAQERIRNALYQLSISPRIGLEQAFDSVVAYCVLKDKNFPKEIVRLMRKKRNDERREFSRRVHQRYRHTGRISLVCNLIQHSPIFLRDKWINDLILERRKIVCCDENQERRSEALGDLKAIAEALVSERLPTGTLHYGKKWKPLSAKRPRQTIDTAVELQGRYLKLLEICTCLIEGKSLTREQWALGGRFSPDPENLARYAELFGVPEDWIKTAWAKGTKARPWAIQKLVSIYGGTPAGMRSRLEKAEALRKDRLEVINRSNEAHLWLMEDRDRPSPDAS